MALAKSKTKTKPPVTPKSALSQCNPFTTFPTSFEEAKQTGPKIAFKPPLFHPPTLKYIFKTDDDGCDDIPDERSPQQAYTTTINKSFMPETNEIRVLPKAAGSDGCSKHLLERSTHFSKRLRTLTDKGPRLCKFSFLSDKGYSRPPSATELLLHKASIKDTKDSETTPRTETMPRKTRLCILNLRGEVTDS